MCREERCRQAGMFGPQTKELLCIKYCTQSGALLATVVRIKKALASIGASTRSVGKMLRYL